jgi:hypothetical protein
MRAIMTFGLVRNRVGLALQEGCLGSSISRPQLAFHHKITASACTFDGQSLRMVTSGSGLLRARDVRNLLPEEPVQAAETLEAALELRDGVIAGGEKH